MSGMSYTGLFHWGITHVVFALSFLDDAARTGGAPEDALPKVDELLGKAGLRCNEALQYKPDLFRAAMMIAVIHHFRAVAHSGLINIRCNPCLHRKGLPLQAQLS